MKDETEIFRGSVAGTKKYCRVLIRRKRASLQEAIDYFRDAVQETDKIIAECSSELEDDLRAQQACFVTALVALDAMREELLE